MLELKTKQQLAKEAFTIASGYNLVHYRSVNYIPADYETRETAVPPALDRTIWLPLNRDRLRLLAAADHKTLFATGHELTSFDFMVSQNAMYVEDAVQSLLVRGPSGLTELNGTGTLHDPTGEFRPNALQPLLNEDKEKKAECLRVIVGWLDSEEEAESLLTHLATCLAPGWSAVKYVLLLGEGRNGKSLLLKMMHALFGRDNVSNVTRQQISEQSPVVTQLNGKLLNLVYDGQGVYLKDSGAEKTLIAGEPFPIRELYSSVPTTVQTSALFVEGLQHEPKSNDKSAALQKRLVRFAFPNVYALDHRFERYMLREEMLGAFLSLLVDRYVTEDSVAERLMPTTRSMELQLEHLYVNSKAMQFIKHIEENDPLGAVGLLGLPMSDLVSKFQAWRVRENDLGTWSEPDVQALFMPLFNTERKTKGRGPTGAPRKVRILTSLKAEAAAFINSLKEEPDEAHGDTVVDE